MVVLSSSAALELEGVALSAQLAPTLGIVVGNYGPKHTSI